METSKWQVGTRRCALESWDDLAQTLAVHIQHLKEGGFRYIVVSDSTWYVQLASLGDGSIHSEASHRDREGAERLSPTVCKRLLRLGWLTAEAPDPGATRRARAFLRRWPRTTASDEIAEGSVKTLRDVFGIASPAALTIRRSEFSERSVPTIKKSGEWVSPGNRVQPPKNPSLHLPAGSIVRNAHSGRQYRVENLLGSGGFGAAYRATQVSGSRLSGGCVLKIATDPQGWHREAYFGELLRGEPGIVSVYETFAWVPQGEHRRPLYCLVSELAEGGDLARHLRERPVPWTESRARREITRLARAVKLLHASGAVHRDITPGNVLVTPGGVLKLGDFGIALHRAGSRNVAADAFAPRFAPLPIRGRETVSWKPADDVYQLGQLFAFMLIGRAHATVTPRDVKTLACSAEVKAVIQRCIGERRRRFANAEEMLGALGSANVPAPRQRVVRSLLGKHVVFTGTMGILRAKAKRLVKKAGGTVENNISRATDIVVVGQHSPNWKADKKGRKLLDVDRERELGHDIAVISERRFRNLVGLG
jgi:serine/threonine-protein kinase